jgi:bifunctional non-homologous end joining protein LigD
MTTVIRQYTPMAPTLVRAPFHRAGWVYEEKVDGYRMLAYKDGARVRLVSRNGRDHTRRFHQIAMNIGGVATASGSGSRNQSKRERSCWS